MYTKTLQNVKELWPFHWSGCPLYCYISLLINSSKEFLWWCICVLLYSLYSVLCWCILCPLVLSLFCFCVDAYFVPLFTLYSHSVFLSIIFTSLLSLPPIFLHWNSELNYIMLHNIVKLTIPVKKDRLLHPSNTDVKLWLSLCGLRESPYQLTRWND